MWWRTVILLAVPSGLAAADRTEQQMGECAASECFTPSPKKSASMLQVAAKGGSATGAVSAVSRMASRMAAAAATGHSAGMASGLQEAEALVDAFRGLSAVADKDPTHLSGVDKSALESVKDVVEKQIFENMQTTSNADQAEVDDYHAALVKCDTTRQAAQDGVVAGSLVTLKSARESHKLCRTAESEVSTKSSTALSDYQELEQIIPEPPPCTPYTKNLDSMAQYFNPETNPVLKWYKMYASMFEDKKAKSEAAGRERQSRVSSCDGLQRDTEQDYCSYKREVLSACGAYESCHKDSLGKYKEAKERVQKNEASRKAFHKSGHAVICHLEVVLKGLAHKTHESCTDDVAGLDSSRYAITYPAETDKAACDVSGVSSFPCDASWAAAEFSWMPPNVVAAACSRCASETPAPTPAPTAAPTPAPTAAPTPAPVTSCVIKSRDGSRTYQTCAPGWCDKLGYPSYNCGGGSACNGEAGIEKCKELLRKQEPMPSNGVTYQMLNHITDSTGSVCLGRLTLASKSGGVAEYRYPDGSWQGRGDRHNWFYCQ